MIRTLTHGSAKRTYTVPTWKPAPYVPAYNLPYRNTSGEKVATAPYADFDPGTEQEQQVTVELTNMVLHPERSVAVEVVADGDIVATLSPFGTLAVTLAASQQKKVQLRFRTADGMFMTTNELAAGTLTNCPFFRWGGKAESFKLVGSVNAIEAQDGDGYEEAKKKDVSEESLGSWKRTLLSKSDAALTGEVAVNSTLFEAAVMRAYKVTSKSKTYYVRCEDAHCGANLYLVAAETEREIATQDYDDVVTVTSVDLHHTLDDATTVSSAASSPTVQPPRLEEEALKEHLGVFFKHDPRSSFLEEMNRLRELLVRVFGEMSASAVGIEGKAESIDNKHFRWEKFGEFAIVRGETDTFVLKGDFAALEEVQDSVEIELSAGRLTVGATEVEPVTAVDLGKLDMDKVVSWIAAINRQVTQEVS